MLHTNKTATLCWSLSIITYFLLSTFRAATAQDLVCLSPEKTTIAVTIYSDKLEAQQVIQISAQVDPFPNYAFLSPDKSLLVLEYWLDRPKKQPSQLLLVDMKTGQVTKTITAPEKTHFTGGEWTSEDTFQYLFFPPDSEKPAHLVELYVSSGSIQPLPDRHDTQYKIRKKRAVEWFHQLKLKPPFLLDQGGDSFANIGFFTGNSVGAVSKDGNTAVIMTSSAFSKKGNDRLAVVSRGRLVGMLPYPDTLKEVKLKIVGKFLTIGGVEKGKPCVLIVQLSNLKLLEILNQTLVADE